MSLSFKIFYIICLGIAGLPGGTGDPGLPGLPGARGGTGFQGLPGATGTGMNRYLLFLSNVVKILKFAFTALLQV